MQFGHLTSTHQANGEVGVTEAAMREAEAKDGGPKATAYAAKTAFKGKISQSRPLLHCQPGMLTMSNAQDSLPILVLINFARALNENEVV